MEPIETPLLTLAEKIKTNPVEIPIVSSALGKRIEQVDARYLRDIVMETVRFQGALSALTSEKDCLFVDLSPNGLLAGIMKHDASGPADSCAAVNQFGQNTNTMNNLYRRISA
jgi:acyl transferase domain-containing protein